ncbi:hypothetical protein P2318_32805 [Myxococcaceae bacterium GXIMD 01537]
MQKPSSELGLVRIDLEFTLSAPRERCWQALVGEVGQWWRQDFYMGHAVQPIVFEARPGGRLYEDWGNGAGLLWYTVLALEPPNALDLVGHLAPAFGGPATSMLRLSFKEVEGTTVLQLSDSVFGRVSEDSATRLRQGWQLLFGEGFKPHVEKATPSAQ